MAERVSAKSVHSMTLPKAFELLGEPTATFQSIKALSIIPYAIAAIAIVLTILMFVFKDRTQSIGFYILGGVMMLIGFRTIKIGWRMSRISVLVCQGGVVYRTARENNAIAWDHISHFEQRRVKRYISQGSASGKDDPTMKTAVQIHLGDRKSEIIIDDELYVNGSELLTLLRKEAAAHEIPWKIAD